MTLTLTSNLMRAMAMIYSPAKVQGQRSIGSEDGVETNGETGGHTDGGDCITSLANAIGNNLIAFINTPYRTFDHTTIAIRVQKVDQKVDQCRLTA